MISTLTRGRRTAASLASVLGLAALAGCGGSSDSASNAGATTPATGTSGPQLALVAYSTPQTAYDTLTKGFAQTAAGSGVTFTESFGASGAQSRAVDSGQPADIVAFSTTPDITRLVKDGLVSASWDANRYKGIVTDSVVTLVVRKGNPKHITGWDDLVKPGIDVVTPNPSTSGSARWNVLAAYGAQLKEGKTPAQALAYVKELLTKHVSVQPASGRAALQAFAGGKGDVLVSYESEAIGAKKKGLAVDYVVPKQTILIETPIAVTSKTAHAVQAKAFLDYVWSAPAQAIWAKAGYRPVDPAVLAQYKSAFPAPPQLFTIGFLGGWKAATKTFFDPQSGSITKIEQSAGVPTAAS